jgi:hypothetical protein
VSHNGHYEECKFPGAVRKYTDVSEEYIISIFGIESKLSKKPARTGGKISA